MHKSKRQLSKNTSDSEMETLHYIPHCCKANVTLVVENLPGRPLHGPHKLGFEGRDCLTGVVGGYILYKTDLGLARSPGCDLSISV